MLSNNTSNQTCINSDNASNKIGLVVYCLVTVVAVLAYIAVTYYQKFTKLSLKHSIVLAKLAKPYKEEVLFNSDTLSRIVSFLPSID